MRMRLSTRLLFLIHTTSGALFTVEDGVRPGLATGDPAQSISWSEGGPAFVLASAGAVRINFRAIYTYPPDAVLRPLDKGLGWHGTPCNVSAWALCTADVGHTLAQARPRMPERSEAPTADGWNDLSCAKSEGKVLVSLGVYDITACDILDEGLDLVYTPGMIYHRHNTLYLWKYWGLVFIAVVLVRSLSFNLKDLWQPQKARQKPTKKQWPALLACILALAIVLTDVDHYIVTSADQVFLWATIAYIGVYLVIHAIQMFWFETWNYPVYNVIIAAIQLIVSRFFSAAETPYNLVLFTVLAARGWSVTWLEGNVTTRNV